MKATIGALMMSSSAVVLGMIVATEASFITFTAVQQGSISADTPVGGLTVGLVVVGGFAALVAAIKGAHSLIMFTLACGRWVQTMNETVVKVAEHQKELDALQRWRVHLVDPSLLRSGIGRPNPAGEIEQLYRDEAAG